MPIKKIVHYVTLAAIFLVPIFPLIVANSFFFPFITAKGFYFRILVEVAFASWVILAFMDAKYRPKFTALTIGVTLFTVITLIADLLGINPIRSLWSNFERMEGWITIVHLWAFYIVMTSVFGTGDDSRRMWHRWFNTSIGVAFFVFGYGLFQYFGWAATHQGATRIDASLGNSSYMAVYMMMHAFLAAYMFFIVRIKKIKPSPQWLYAVLAVAFSFIVFETQTRGTILGLIGGVMLALFLYAIFGPKTAKRARSTSGIIIIAIIALVGLFWVNRHASWIERNPVLGRFSNLSWYEASNQARQYIWPMAVQGAMKRPILGLGQENFNYIFNADYNPGMYNQEQWFDRAHNVFLDWLVASGILGLVAYLALYVIFLREIWKSHLTVAEKSVLTGLLAGYAIHNVFVFDNLASYVVFFAALGFSNSIGEKKATLIGGDKPVRLDAVEYIVAPIAIVAVAVVIFVFNVRPIQANTGLIDAIQSCSTAQPDVSLFEKVLQINTYVANQEIREQIMPCTANVIQNQAIPIPTKQSFFNLATKEIQAQVAATPKDARIYALGGAFYEGVGQFKEAQPLLEKAHELSPKKQSIDFELASNYLSTEMPAKAIAVLKEAYDSAPEFYQAQEAYATALIADGKEDEAHKLFGNNPSIFETDQVAQAYANMKQYSKAIAIYKNLASSNTSDLNLRVRLAQVQYLAGLKSDAIATLRTISTDHPELKAQIDEAIKQVQG
jgi:O-antigen ligase/Flp pilus assembly protein TadD